MIETWRIAWARFNLIGKIIGEVQGRIIVTVFYFTIVVPFGVGSRLFTDPLRRRSSQPAWLDRPPLPEGLDAAHQQG